MADSDKVWRILSVVERMGTSLTEASGYLTAALEAIDTEMTNLRQRLHGDAQALREAVAGVEVSDVDRERLLEAVARVEFTAARVASFAHPPPGSEQILDTMSKPTTSPPQEPDLGVLAEQVGQILEDPRGRGDGG